MQTTNNDIKIIRLQSGEDIIASYNEKEESVTLGNPMHIIFKRISTGQTVMMMTPWLPIEIIKENYAMIYSSDILTIIEPKEDLIEYYSEVVLEAQRKMEEKVPFGLDDDDEEEFDPEELIELLKEKKKGKIH
jgi:hypothetical protein